MKAKRYRVVYRFNDAEKTVEILLVGHGRDVYDALRGSSHRRRIADEEDGETFTYYQVQ